jgi:uncharacterized protein YkwD
LIRPLTTSSVNESAQVFCSDPIDRLGRPRASASSGFVLAQDHRRMEAGLRTSLVPARRRETTMTPIVHDRVPPTLPARGFRPWLILGLVAGLAPGGPAHAGTRGRAVPKPVPKARQAALAKRAAILARTTAAARKAVVPAATASVAAAPVQPPIEQQIFALTNQARQANGFPALVIDPALTRAAQIQADAMAAFNDMDHSIPGEALPTFVARLSYVGYNYLWAAENIAFNAPDAPSVVTDWLNSPPHRADLLSPFPKATGVAVTYNTQGQPYYCQVFGVSP